MRVVRASGENISPSDDGSLFQNVLNNGLFEDVTITSLGSNQVSVPALYGILQGREFTNSSQSLDVALPSSGTATGYIYVQYDLAATPIGTLESALAPFTPAVGDINGTDTVAQMVIATYEASAIAVTDITMTYPKATIKGSRYEADITLTTSSWSSGYYTVTDAHIDPDKMNILSYDPTITDAQFEAYLNAMIRPYGAIQSGSLQLKAVGGTPSVDLPMVLIVRE